MVHHLILQVKFYFLSFGRAKFPETTSRTKLFLKINKIFPYYRYIGSFSSVQSLSHVRFFVTPWTAARQASVSITNSRSLLKLISIESVMPLSSEQEQKSVIKDDHVEKLEEEDLSFNIIIIGKYRLFD